MVNTAHLEHAKNHTFNDDNFKINKDVETEITEHAKTHGIDPVDQKFVDDSDLRFRVKSKIQINEAMLEAQKAHNEDMMEKKQEKVDEYEVRFFGEIRPWLTDATEPFLVLT
jgi:hypothetical protein